MGQKVSPTGFRLGVTEDWRSVGIPTRTMRQTLKTTS